jgi:hypothetical protein
MPLVILHYFLNVSVQLANKRGFKQKKTCAFVAAVTFSQNRCIATIGKYTDIQTGGMYLRSKSLRWTQVPRHIYQVS